MSCPRALSHLVNGIWPCSLIIIRLLKRTKPTERKKQKKKGEEESRTVDAFSAMNLIKYSALQARYLIQKDISRPAGRSGSTEVFELHSSHHSADFEKRAAVLGCV